MAHGRFTDCRLRLAKHCLPPLVNAALDSLRSARALIPCVHSFHLSSRDHAIDLPTFPRLTHAFLSLRASDPNVSILTDHQYLRPDQHYFDMIPHLSSFVDYSLFVWLFCSRL